MQRVTGQERCPHFRRPEKWIAPVHASRLKPCRQPSMLRDGRSKNQYRSIPRKPAAIQNCATMRVRIIRPAYTPFLQPMKMAEVFYLYKIQQRVEAVKQPVET